MKLISSNPGKIPIHEFLELELNKEFCAQIVYSTNGFQGICGYSRYNACHYGWEDILKNSSLSNYNVIDDELCELDDVQQIILNLDL